MNGRDVLMDENYSKISTWITKVAINLINVKSDTHTETKSQTRRGPHLPVVAKQRVF
jgi:hypothetical protein